MRSLLVYVALLLLPVASFGQTKPDDEIIYAWKCGYAPQHPPERLLMNGMVAQRDTAQLANWVRSGNTALACYGAEGLRRLETTGMTLSAELLKSVEEAEQSKRHVLICRGCIVHTQTMREALANPQLRGE